jgi:hypothetical protein
MRVPFRPRALVLVCGLFLSGCYQVSDSEVKGVSNGPAATAAEYVLTIDGMT